MLPATLRFCCSDVSRGYFSATRSMRARRSGVISFKPGGAAATAAESVRLSPERTNNIRQIDDREPVRNMEASLLKWASFTLRYGERSVKRSRHRAAYRSEE